jgi:hypothetical protein
MTRGEDRGHAFSWGGELGHLSLNLPQTRCDAWDAGNNFHVTEFAIGWKQNCGSGEQISLG